MYYYLRLISFPHVIYAFSHDSVPSQDMAPNEDDLAMTKYRQRQAEVS